MKCGDRYYAIVHPLKPRQTKRRFFCSIGTIWASSILFSLPALLYSDTEELMQSLSAETFDEVEHNELSLLPFKSSNNNSTNESWLFTMNLLSTTETSVFNTIVDNATLNYLSNQLFQSTTTSTTTMTTTTTTTSAKNESIDPLGHGSHVFVRTLCIMRWPDGVSGFSTYEFLYNMAFLVFFYVIPVLTMVVALALMSRVLWPRELIGEHTTVPQNILIRSKRKVVCILICVISVFALCWLPYHSYFISIYWWPSLIKTPGIKHIYLAFYWFAMANSLFNPVILFAMNRRMRNYLKYYVKCACCTLMKNKKREKLFRNMHYHQHHNRQQQSNPMRMLNYHYHYYPHRNNFHHHQHFHHSERQCNQSPKLSQQSAGQQFQLQQTQAIQTQSQQLEHRMNKAWTNQSNGIMSDVSLPVSLMTINTRHHHRAKPKSQPTQPRQPPLKTMKKVEFCCSKRNMHTSSDRSSDLFSEDNDQSLSRMTRLKSEASAVGSRIRNNLNNHYHCAQHKYDDDHHSCPTIFVTHSNHNKPIDGGDGDKSNGSQSLKMNISLSNIQPIKFHQSLVEKSLSVIMDDYPPNTDPVSV
ncbi:hypothetical protein DERF_006930 [Dermatophagoides farinae]|uniref:G-protein coupled receptors family 1 profile domain-containing protein n=1 Tax=Dermatophagoides farinae TaxID=6954 RepID=A0A922I2E1_DERFA|nr:hypothetical protein DERF_006930 [Dermatophagoides farinae]